MTKETLEAKLQELKTGFEQTRSTLDALGGAIQIVQQLLQVEEAVLHPPPKTVGPQLVPDPPLATGATGPYYHNAPTSS